MERHQQHSDDCFATDPWPTSCTCGADQHNAAALQQLHPIKPKRLRTLLGTLFSHWTVKPAGPSK